MAGAEDLDRNVINVWSGPRCVSTSLMYSFAQRGDTQVVDEPLYAAYLRLTGAERPYREQVLASQDNDGARVVAGLLLGPRQKKVLYAKHMAKQRVAAVGAGRGLMRGAAHVLLVRHPAAVISSFAEVLEPTLGETCYPALLEIYSELRALGRPPPVILSEDLVAAPEATLRALCSALGLEFDEKMLSWPAGGRPEDGVWAPWWYANTHKATGFHAQPESRTGGRADGGDAAPRPKATTAAAAAAAVPERLRPLLEECRPLYEMLRQRALRPREGGAGAGPDPLGAAGPPQPQPPPPAGAGVGGSEGKGGTHAYAADPRNADILIGIRDGVTGQFDLVWRPAARVSVFDSGFILGDGQWEAVRLHKGVCLFLHRHLARLYEGAAAIDMRIGLTPAQLAARIYETVDANGMEDGVHVRLMVTRGMKPTPYQNPTTTIGAPTVVIIPEHKQAAAGPKERGIRLFTTHVRRGAPDVQDPSWNSHSKLNCIAACIQANKAGADEALMLDPHGFVATCNSTNFFVVRGGEVWAPTRKYQLHGITRQNVLDLCAAAGIPARELDFSLTQVYSADEAFVTGTFAGQIPVVEVDGRVIGDGRRGPVTERLQRLYAELCDRAAGEGRQLEKL